MKYLSIIIIVLSLSGFQSTAQPKIILAKCRCSTIRNEKLLYDRIKGSPGLDTAFARIVNFFRESNGDYFQLQCASGCIPPLVMEFPFKRNNFLSREKEGLNSVYIDPNNRIGIGIAMLGGDSTEQILSDLFSDCLKHRIINSPDSELALIEIHEKGLTSEIQIENDPIPRLIHIPNEYTIIGRMLHGNLFLAENDRYLVQVIKNDTREIIRSKVFEFKGVPDRGRPSHALGLMHIPRPAKLDKAMLKSKVSHDADDVVNDLIHTLFFSQRDTINTISFTFPADSAGKAPSKAEIELLAPVLHVQMNKENAWTITAACTTDCLVEMLKDSPIGRQYYIDSDHNHKIQLYEPLH